MKWTKLKYSLKATSLVETLIASVISAICFAVGLMMYTNILKSNFNNLQAESKLFIEEQIQLSINQKNYKSENVFLDNILIEKKVSFYQGQEDVIHINFIAKDTKGKILVEQNLLHNIEN